MSIILPEGVVQAAVRPPKKGELYVYQGEILEASRDFERSELVLRLLPGYERHYNVQFDHLEIWKTPEPLPQPESGDWLDVAFDEFSKHLTAKATHYPWTGVYGATEKSILEVRLIDRNELVQLHQASNSGAGVECRDEDLRVTEGTKVEAFVREHARRIAEAMNADGKVLVTVDLKVPKGLEEARSEVRNGVSMRYVRGKVNGAWIIRFDVLYGVVRHESALVA